MMGDVHWSEYVGMPLCAAGSPVGTTDVEEVTCLKCRMLLRMRMRADERWSILWWMRRYAGQPWAMAYATMMTQVCQELDAHGRKI